MIVIRDPRSQSISAADVFAIACAEHIAAWERLERRAQRGDRARFVEGAGKSARRRTRRTRSILTIRGFA